METLSAIAFTDLLLAIITIMLTLHEAQVLHLVQRLAIGRDVVKVRGHPIVLRVAQGIVSLLKLPAIFACCCTHDWLLEQGAHGHCLDP